MSYSPDIDKGEHGLHKEILDIKDVNKADAEHMAVLTEEEKMVEKKLKKKIDSLIMPLVVLVYLMNYIDRNNYAAAKLQGLIEDLSLSPAQYQTGLSILFVGYVSFGM